MALNSTAAARLKFPFEYCYIDGWDLQVVLRLSEHINFTIYWEPFSVMLVTDAGRQQGKHLFKRTIKDYQYTIKVTFDGVEALVLSLLLEYSASLWSDMLYSLSSLVSFSLSVSKFSLPSILGCLMLHCMCSMLHCMLTSHGRSCQVPFGWKLMSFVTLKCLGCFSVKFKFKILP